MKLGIVAGYSPAQIALPMEQILEAERLGFDSVWTAEAYGSDAVTTASWILARTSTINVGTSIVQMPARTPACTAMTAMTLDQLSGGRFILGIGPSGPQVIEGWHGLAYGKPLERTREYISIIRKILAREEPLQHEGMHYQIPYRGADATGLGKPLKSILHGNPAMKIYTAAITAGGIRCSAEVADGVFPLWMIPERFDLIEKPLQEGFVKAGNGKGLGSFDILPFVQVSMGEDVEQCRQPVKAHMALYIGGMGARDKNYYNDFARRAGYKEAAVRIQDLFLAGKKAEAAAAVPDQLVDDCALIGPPARIRERLQAWQEAGRRQEVTSLLVAGNAPVEALRLLAEQLL
jgi:F420-dependent oxidoreductase-like protein